MIGRMRSDHRPPGPALGAQWTVAFCKLLILSAPWKGGGPQRVEGPPGNWFAPPGSNRSSSGGNEAAEASDVEGRYGDLASVQAVT
jgi:hypothetical protein